jgi:hypothetical protein
MRNKLTWSVLLTVVLVPLLSASSPETDPLPSWNDCAARTAILEFVKRVTTEGDDWVPEQDRVAVLDQDGTLLCEQPLPVHVLAIQDRYRDLIKQNPDLSKLEPFKSISESGNKYFKGLIRRNQFEELVRDAMGVPFEGMTTDEYRVWTEHFLETWVHPRFHTNVLGLVYQPMYEVVQYLQANEFDVFIISADEAAFIRVFALEAYGVASSNIAGSSIRLELNESQTPTVLIRTSTPLYFDGYAGKARTIGHLIGRRPILGVGNSDGDLEMLEYISPSQTHPSLCLVVDHSDGVREYVYKTDTGKLRAAAATHAWPIVDIKHDWNHVFRSPTPFKAAKHATETIVPK